MTIILSAHQPAYLPWLGLFHKILLADVFVVFDNVPFSKDSFDNRNKIRTSAGAVWLTVPVVTKSKSQIKLVDAEIDNTHNLSWRKKHLRTIEQNYCNSPYFKQYIDFFREIYSQKWDRLFLLCDSIFRYLLDALGIHTKILYAHDFDFEGKKSDLVLDMCKQLKADLFIFGQLGYNYAVKEDFYKSGIGLYFQEYCHPVYPQSGTNFISHLSVIDLLFNVGGTTAADIIMKGNITKSELERKLKL